MVAFGHSFTMLVNGRLESPHFHLASSNAFLAFAQLLFQPNTSVIFFYVLSGLVLGESLRADSKVPWLPRLLAFAVKRITRIVPAMWVSIVFAWLVIDRLHGATFQGATPWFNAFFATPVSVSQMGRNFLGFGEQINSVLWSVQIELAIIPFLPIAVLLISRVQVWADVLVFTCFAWLSLRFWGQAWNVLLYFYCFYLGLMLPKLMCSKFAAILRNGFVTIAGLALLFPIDFFYSRGELWMPMKFIGNALISGQLLAFVILRRDHVASRVLGRRWLVWIGDISYSLYAYAMTVLLVVGYFAITMASADAAPDNQLATLLSCATALICLALTLLMAHYSYKWIEHPGAALGRSVAARIQHIFANRNSRPAMIYESVQVDVKS